MFRFTIDETQLLIGALLIALVIVAGLLIGAMFNDHAEHKEREHHLGGQAKG